jgi:hypothetical protein
MTAPLVALDSEVILAYCLGPENDPRAETAVQAISEVRGSGCRLVYIESVKREVDAKLAEMDVVVDILRDFRTESPSAMRPLSLRELELIFTKIRRRGERISRYVDAVERLAAAQIGSNEGSRPVLEISAIVILAARQVRQRFDLRLDELTVGGSMAEPGLNSSRTPKPPGVGTKDWEHLQRCSALGASASSGVLFVSGDSDLIGYKSTIEEALPWVRISNHLYVGMYLAADATEWGIPPTAEGSA